MVLKYLYNYAYPERIVSTVNAPEEKAVPQGEINDRQIKEEKALENAQIEEIKATEQSNGVNKTENVDFTSTNAIKI